MIVFAIVVLYHPEKQSLLEILQSLLSQSAQPKTIILVDNTEGDIECDIERDIKCDIEKEKIIYIALGKNTGIAHAQNVGVKKAKEMGAEWILFCDQDTVFPFDYIESFEKKIAIYGGNNVFAPCVFNETKKTISCVSVAMNKTINVKKLEKKNIPIEAFCVISSGTLVAVDTLNEIGLMEEKLFIDYVDFLWCWKARSKGMKILCFPDIVINHKLGDKSKRVLFLNVTIRSNIRYYYMVRNGLYLARTCKYLNKREKRILFFRTVKFIVGIFLIAKNKKAAFLLLKKAMKDAKQMQKEKR